jgi:hypothetical protein
MSEVLGGLAINGKLIMIGASDEPLEVSPNFFLSGRRSVVGWPADLPSIRKIHSLLVRFLVCGQ